MRPPSPPAGVVARRAAIPEIVRLPLKKERSIERLRQTGASGNSLASPILWLPVAEEHSEPVSARALYRFALRGTAVVLKQREQITLHIKGREV